MINDKNLKQEGAEGSTNLQAQIITINQGLSYSDVKEIADGIFKSNFMELSEKAANIAQERVDELVDKFLDGLKNRNPETLQNMEDPAMQYALFTAQKEYAKSGDKDLGDILVDILVDRAALSERSLKQIVLDESLDVVSKLTDNQLDTLTIIFLLKHTINNDLDSLEKLDEYLNINIKPFVSGLSKENSLFQHLEYCGCSTISDGLLGLEGLFNDRYKGLFSNGFTVEEFIKTYSPIEKYNEYFTTSLHDVSKLQIGFRNDDDLEEKLSQNKVPSDIIENLKQFFNLTTMPLSDIKSYLINKREYMSTLFDIWENSHLQGMSITSVGIALAQANFRRKTGISIDLGIWIK